MDSDSLKQAKKVLTIALEGRRRDPFPIFLRAWILTLLPWIGTICWLAFFKGWWVLWVFAAVIAGLTQNALGLLMHEGSHFFFHHDKKTNDFWCNLLVCLPIFNTVHGYRVPHAEHHRTSGDSRDPYFELYADYPTRGHVINGFILDWVGISAVQKFIQRYRPTGKRALEKEAPYVLPCLFIVQTGIAGLLWQATGEWFAYLFLWVLPLMTIPIFINRFRTIVEHYPGFLGIKINRTSLTGLFEYLCIAPYGYSHHLEHHLLPHIPYYELNFTHRFLQCHGVTFTENEVNTHGYLQTFFRLMREIRTS